MQADYCLLLHQTRGRLEWRIMQIYDGTLIYRIQDEFGPIEVVENSAHRSLHFGTEPKQSSMQLDNPIALALSYTRAMTSALLFIDTPQRVLLVGLGGGSLAKFILAHFPHCELDVVEFRPEVYATARAWFALPDEPRLTVHIDDGAAFVRRAAASHSVGYDLILIDAFEAMGIADSVCASTFFDNCHTLLNREGMVAMNLWSRDRHSLEHILNQLGSSFNGELLELPIGGKENVIALAGTLTALKRRLKKLGEHAKSLEQRLGVEYPYFLRALRKHNRSFFF